MYSCSGLPLSDFHHNLLTQLDRTGRPQDLHIGILQHRRPLRHLRSRGALCESLPTAAGQQAVLLGDRGRRAEPQEVSDEWERGCGADGVVCRGLCVFTWAYIETGRLNRRCDTGVRRMGCRERTALGLEGVDGGRDMLDLVFALVPRKPLP